MHLVEIVDAVMARQRPPTENDLVILELKPEECRAMNGLLAALRRVASESVDTCKQCGQLIGVMRLIDHPTTDLCENCAVDEDWRPGAP